MKSSSTILIPSYNGLTLLKTHLPSVVRHSHGCPIIIIDDCSTDNSVNWIQTHYPQITLIRNHTNLGFSRSVNLGFAKAKTKYVFLLNNDVSIFQSTLPQLEESLNTNKQAFAVGALEQLPNGTHRGKSTASIKRGLFSHSATAKQSSGFTLWVFMASGLFRRNIFLKLGGLNPVYAPAYWEDIDLSYRAWKAGYPCLFNSQARVNHQTEATMNQTLGNSKTTLSFRNQFLFTWLNLTEPKLLFSHIVWLPINLILISLKSRGAYLVAFLQALLSYLHTQTHPATSHPTAVYSDSQILKIVHHDQLL